MNARISREKVDRGTARVRGELDIALAGQGSLQRIGRDASGEAADQEEAYRQRRLWDAGNHSRASWMSLSQFEAKTVSLIVRFYRTDIDRKLRSSLLLDK